MALTWKKNKTGDLATEQLTDSTDATHIDLTWLGRISDLEEALLLHQQMQAESASSPTQSAAASSSSSSSSSPTPPASSATVDLTASGNSGQVNGAYFAAEGVQSAGTGVFDTFVQIQHNGTEQGYNTDHRPQQFDEKNSAQHNHSLLLSNIPIVFGNGVVGDEATAYREFLIDANEGGGGNSLLSLDRLQIFQETSGNLTGFTPGVGFGAPGEHLVYDLDAGGDHWIALDAGLSSGGGQSDVRVLIPDALFDPSKFYVVVYSGFGFQGNGWSTGGGFEEWGTDTANAPGGGGNASLNIAKNASVPGGTADTVGEEISYTITVTNSGAANLTGVIVTDPFVSDLMRAGDISGDNDNVLEAGEIWSYTAHHTVTQADLDTGGGGDGAIENTATVDTDQTAPQSASASVLVERSPHLVITKTAVIPDADTDNDPTLDDGEIDDPADDVSYTITLFNDGNVTQTSVFVIDTLLGELTTHTESGGSGVNGDDILDVGETWTYTASYDVTQGDIDNRGSVDGTADDNIHNEVNVLTDSFAGSATADVAIDYRPHLVLTKTATIPDVDTPNDPTLGDGEIDDPADDISYAFTLVNDGNVTLHSVLLNDTLLGVLTTHTESGGTGVNGDDILDVGETWSYAASYDVTQADIDNRGSVDGTADDNIRNDASVFTDEGASGTAFAEVPIDYRPHLLFTKSATIPDADNDGKIDDPSDDISYAFTLVNDGNVTLHSVLLNDSLLGVLITHTESGGTGVNGDGILDVGETWSYAASYDVMQSDIDNRGSVDGTADDKIRNDASVFTDEGASGTAFAEVPIDYRPSVDLEKEASVPGGTANEAGELIEYTITVENTGNVTLTNPVVTDNFASNLHGADANEDTFNDGDLNQDGQINVGETWVYLANHVVTQAEIDAGGTIDNTASVDTDQDATDSDTASVPVGFVLELDKSSSPLIDGDESGGPSEDDPIQYFFSLTNNGSVALHDVDLDDSLMGTMAFTPDSPDANGLLDPGETWLMSTTYLITADQADDGFVDNDATATGLNPSNVLVTSNTAHWHLEF